MILLPFILFFIGWVVVKFIFHYKWYWILVFSGASLLLSLLVVGIDYTAQTTDTEVWSGRVIDWEHKEEWDEWHPPVTTCTTDSKGNETCDTEPGYWEHHPAENRIKTTDNGWFSVKVSPSGKRMDDSWPNTTKELQEMWPEGTPSASTHTYTNKVQASYSIYKHPEIDLEDYPDLPKYPAEVTNYIYVDRIVGDVPNKAKALEVLAEWNSELNKPVPNPEKPGKTMSWKQVNLIFVNVGADKPIEYGYALQDYWEGGNKNDFIVSFSMNSDGKLNWVYPFFME